LAIKANSTDLLHTHALKNKCRPLKHSQAIALIATEHGKRNDLKNPIFAPVKRARAESLRPNPNRHWGNNPNYGYKAKLEVRQEASTLKSPVEWLSFCVRPAIQIPMAIHDLGKIPFGECGLLSSCRYSKSKRKNKQSS
jgi:hypothetical protein